MKKIFLSILLFSLSQSIWAQTRGISYQAVARDNTGTILAGQSINVAFLLRTGTTAGPVIYQETFSASTNAFGLINLEIGQGTPVSGNFATINWGSDRHFLEVQFNGVSAGVQELVAVPYAKVATDMSLDLLSDVSSAGASNSEVLKWNGTEWAPATDAVNDADASTTNEIQTISLSGTTLSLSLGGGSVNLPTGSGGYSAGTGIAISGTNVISNTGDTDASNDITNTTPAGGDLGGLYPNPTVTKIRNVAVSTTAPSSNQVLKYNGTQWAPATDAVDDADASTTNEIQSLSLSGTTLSLSLGGGSVVLPSGGGSYTAGTGISISGANVITNTGDTDASNDITNTTAAGGDLGGLYPNPTVTKIRNVAVSTTAPSSNQVLKYNGTQWAPATDAVDDADASTSNEIQSLSLSGTTLSLSLGGGSVVLPSGTSSQWTTSGSNIHYNTGNVGIGDATPAATLTVGDGDKFQVFGTDGDIVFTDDNANIRFPATTAPNTPMLYMFASGTQNSDRMVFAHSPSFPTWGLEYKDTTDVFFLRSNTGRKFAFELSSGQMGIGIEDPAFPIDMQGRMRIRSTGSLSNSAGIWFSNLANTFDRAFIGMSEPDSIIGIYSQHLGKWAIEFEVMREPRIGINIPAGSPPRAEVHIMHTNFGGSNDGLRIQNEGANSHYWNIYTANGTGLLEFYKQGIKRATIDPTSGAYTAVSDARLKTNISLMSSVLPSVMKLQAKTYQFIDGESNQYYSGFIAQELKEIFPQYVYYGGDDQVLYTVDYGSMSVVALKAIQEQQAEIESLRKELEALKQAIEALKQK
ncbi:MAG: tail fiber domain-containing protein [Bacteroidia bacterium]